MINYVDGIMEFTNDDQTGEWSRSEFPHPLVTVDYDDNGNVLKVVVIMPKWASEACTEASETLGG